MMLEEPSRKSDIINKDFLIVFILLFNALTWYSMVPMVINNILSFFKPAYTQGLLIWTVFSGSIIASGILGSILSKKIGRLNFLYLWMILGVVVSLSPTLLGSITLTNITIISVLFGISFGLGMPSCLAYFADYTRFEYRGRIAGLILLVSNLSALVFVIAMDMFNLVVNSFFLTIWRASGLIIFFFKPKEKIESKIERSTSYMSILHDKPLILYFIPWLMFNLVDRFEWPILERFFSESHLYLQSLIAPLICSFSAFIAGVLSDWIGRKRVVLYGFVTLGIAYAIMSIASTMEISWYLYLAIDSTATGILWVTFLFILWGDLSQSSNREKYYAIGETPYFLSEIIQPLSVPHVLLISGTSAFSLASFFLFLAVFPLLYAPETLPERKIKLRMLRKYVEKAERLQQKYVEKATRE